MLNCAIPPFVLYCVCGPSPFPDRGKEVETMDALITFIQTVAAQVVAYYLCKWLDSQIGKGSKH